MEPTIENQDPTGGGLPPADNGVTGDPPTPEGETPAGTPPKKGGLQERFSELTTEKKRLKEEADRLRTEAAYYRGIAEGATRTGSVAPGDPKKDEGPPELDPNDFNSDADYLKAVAKQVRDQTLAEIKAERDKERKSESKSTTTKVIKEARAKYADFDSVALNVSVPVTQHMYDAAMGDNLGEVLYHLGKNPEEASRIASLSPVQQAKEIGRIETIISSKQPRITNAPNPPKILGGGGGSPPQKSQAEMSRAELHAEWERVRRAKKGM